MIENNELVIDTLTSIIVKSVTQGMTEGIKAFAAHRRIDLRPLPEGKGFVYEVVEVLTSPRSKERTSNIAYPFKQSFPELWDQVCVSLGENLKGHFTLGDLKAIESTSRTVMYAETIKFLEENLKESLGLFASIRAENVGERPAGE